MVVPIAKQSCVLLALTARTAAAADNWRTPLRTKEVRGYMMDVAAKRQFHRARSAPPRGRAFVCHHVGSHASSI